MVDLTKQNQSVYEKAYHTVARLFADTFDKTGGFLTPQNFSTGGFSRFGCKYVCIYKLMSWRDSTDSSTSKSIKQLSSVWTFAFSFPENNCNLDLGIVWKIWPSIAKDSFYWDGQWPQTGENQQITFDDDEQLLWSRQVLKTIHQLTGKPWSESEEESACEKPLLRNLIHGIELSRTEWKWTEPDRFKRRVWIWLRTGRNRIENGTGRAGELLDLFTNRRRLIWVGISMLHQS